MILKRLLAVLTALLTALPVQAAAGLCSCEAPAKPPAASCCCGEGHACDMAGTSSEESVGAPAETLGAEACGAMVETAPVVSDAEVLAAVAAPMMNDANPAAAVPARPASTPSPPPHGGPPVYLTACALRC